MKILELCESERPRERLARQGVRSLADGELLAVLLRTGTRELSALELARRLLGSVDGPRKLTALARASAARLAAVPGIGPAKAATLAAAFELGRRMFAEASAPGIAIAGPSDICAVMHPRLRGLDHEECWVLFLDASNHLIASEMMTTGGLDSTVLDCRMVVRRALELRAAALVLVHNHPSGNPVPGRADIVMTERLRGACKTFEISLLDHVIIADDCFYSFDEETVDSFSGINGIEPDLIPGG